MKRWILTWAVLSTLLSSRAAAFSDPELFAQPAERGGGGGRYFTGSPADGQACSACHEGGVAPQVTISGLPDEFEVGAQYEVTLRWDHPELSHGLQLELLTEFGQSPIVELPALDLLPAAARCESAAYGDPAVYLLSVDRRRVLGVRDCGASELTFRFVAPASRRLSISASIVRSDGSGGPEGDGVFDLRHVAYARGLRPRESGCQVSPGERGLGDLYLPMLVVAVLTRQRKLRIAALSVVATMVAVSCYQPEQSARYDEDLYVVDASWSADASAPWSGDIDAASVELDATAQPDAQLGRPTRLVFRVQTAAFGGRYAPRNIGAIWIEDASGAHVKTLARWALTRAMYLRRFQSVPRADLLDAVTSATLQTHQLHEVSWNLRGQSGLEASEGNYRLLIELTDRDASGALLELPFVKGQDPWTTQPADTPQFLAMELSLR